MFRAALLVAALLSLGVAPTPAPAAFPGGNGALLISASAEESGICTGPPRVVARIADEPGCDAVDTYAVYLAGPGRSVIRWLDGNVWSASSFAAWGTSVVLSRGPSRGDLAGQALYRVSTVLGARPVSLHRRGYAPALSADGRWIAYVRSDSYGDNRKVWVTSTSGDPPRLVGDGANPRWSNEGRLAFAGPSGVMVTNVGGRHPREVAGGIFQDWAPSGRQLLVARLSYENDSQRSALYAMGVDGRRPRRLTSFIEDAGVGVRSAVWSPDGRKIAFHLWFNADINIISARSRSPPRPARLAQGHRRRRCTT